MTLSDFFRYIYKITKGEEEKMMEIEYHYIVFLLFAFGIVFIPLIHAAIGGKASLLVLL